jgi:hypothetical protein
MVGQSPPRSSFGCCHARPLEGRFGQFIELSDDRFKFGGVAPKVGEGLRLQLSRRKLGGRALEAFDLKLLITSIPAEPKQARSRSGQHADLMIQIRRKRTFRFLSEVPIANRTDVIRYK